MTNVWTPLSKPSVNPDRHSSAVFREFNVCLLFWSYPFVSGYLNKPALCDAEINRINMQPLVMLSMSVSVKGVALHNIDKDEQNSDPEEIESLDERQLNEQSNATVQEVTTRIVSNLIEDPNTGSEKKTPNYGGAKNARLHTFSSEASEEHHNLSTTVTTQVLNNLREGTNFGQNASKVATWYQLENNSRTALLITISYMFDGEDYVIVIKTPYVTDAYEVSAEDVLSEREQIIRGKPEKSFIYPTYDVLSENIDTGKVKVFNSGTSHTPQYWRQFIQLEDSLDSDEELYEYAKSEESELDEVQQTTEFDRMQELVESGEIPAGDITVTIDGEISFRLPITDVFSEEDIRFAEEGNSKFIILRGSEVDFSARKRSHNKDIFEDLTGRSLRETLSDYIND
jgi:hypothetical protein